MCSQISGRWRTRPRISETICSLSLRPAPRLQAPSIGLVSPACRGSSVAHMAMRPCEACTAHVQGSGLALISRGPPAKAAAPRWGHVILITYFREPQSAMPRSQTGRVGHEDIRLAGRSDRCDGDLRPWTGRLCLRWGPWRTIRSGESNLSLALVSRGKSLGASN